MVAFRIARRSAAQSPGRSVLIVALIALPVIGLAGLATVVTSMVPSTEERLTTELGQTQAQIRMVSPPDPSLVQSPNEPGYYTLDHDKDGPLNYELGDPTRSSPWSLLPGERILTIRSTSAMIRTEHGLSSLTAIQGQPWDESFAGKYEVLAGRTPTSDDEVMASPSALVRLGAQVGDRLSLEAPEEHDIVIVGTLRDRTATAETDQVFARPGALDGVKPNDDLASTVFYLPQTELSWSQVRELNTQGAVVLSRAVALDLPPADETPVPAESPTIPWGPLQIAFPLAGFALFEVVLLAGAAFMVGAKRQQRSLATLASVGGDRRMLFGVIAFGGVILGSVGGAVGTALGIGGAWLYIRLTSDGSATQYPGFHVNPFAIAGIIAFAAFAGLVAAAVPARAASKVDVVAALRNAQRPEKLSVRRPVVGIVLACVGLALTLAGGAIALLPPPEDGSMRQFLIGMALVVLGPVLIQIGIILIAPLLLHGIARAVASFGLGARLGSRDIARNTSRSVPVLAAIMTTVFVGSFAMTFVTSSDAQQRAAWQYSTPINVAQADLGEWIALSGPPSDAQVAQVANAVKSTFGASIARTLSATPVFGDRDGQRSELFPSVDLPPTKTCPDGIYSGAYRQGEQPAAECQLRPYNMYDWRIWVGSAADLAVILGEAVSEESQKTLASGGAVSLYPQYVVDGAVTIGWRSGEQVLDDSVALKVSAPQRSVTLPATVERAPHDYAFGVFVTQATATAIGLDYGPSMVVAPVDAAPTPAQYDSLYAASQSITGMREQAILFRVETGPPDIAGLITWGLLALCALIVLGAASVAIGLARADSKRDEYILAATGSTPALQRSLGFWQAVCLAGPAALIGVVLGTIPILALSRLSPFSTATALPFAPPWLQLGAAAIVIPILIAVGCWLTVRTSRRPTRRTA